MKAGKTPSLQWKKSTFNQEQLLQILSSILLGTTPEDGKILTEGVEAVAEVDGTTLTITIQKSVEGIKVRICFRLLSHRLMDNSKNSGN